MDIIQDWTKVSEVSRQLDFNDQRAFVYFYTKAATFMDSIRFSRKIVSFKIQKNTNQKVFECSGRTD